MTDPIPYPFPYAGEGEIFYIRGLRPLLTTPLLIAKEEGTFAPFSFLIFLNFPYSRRR
jgi:hypothetical protein